MTVNAAALKWVIRVAMAIAIVATVHARFGTSLSLLAMLVLSTAGFLPPVFPLLYKAYTTKTIGYRFRHVLHPRGPPHSTTIPSARRFVQHPGSSSVGVIVIPVPVLADNYAYVIACERTRTCAFVDGADPHRMSRVASGLGLRLTHVFTTHKHWDHAGGNFELQREMGGGGSLQFIGSAVDRPAATTTFVDDGSVVVFGDVRVDIVATPGHTEGHVMLLVSHQPSAENSSAMPLTRTELMKCEAELVAQPPPPDNALSAATAARLRDQARDALAAMLQSPIPTAGANAGLLTGDCIFCGGCGALFECRGAADVLRTYDVLHKLMERHQTGGLVFVGHEYSMRLFAELASRKVATSTAQGDAALKKRHQDVQEARALHFATVPSLMTEEVATNPLLTLKRETLLQLSLDGAPAAAVESAIYLSGSRRT